MNILENIMFNIIQTMMELILYMGNQNINSMDGILKQMEQEITIRLVKKLKI